MDFPRLESRDDIRAEREKLDLEKKRLEQLEHMLQAKYNYL